MPGRRRLRRAIALDETVVKVVRAKSFLWNAVVLWNEETVASYLSLHRSRVDTCLLDRVTERCLNKPLAYMDRSQWYKWALGLYGLRHRVEAFDGRNQVEAWFSRLKARTKRFYNNLPYGSSLESVARWIDSFTAIHNLRRTLS